MKRVLLLALSSCLWGGDAQRGMAIAEEQSCLDCHTVNAQGAGHEANATAPDLGVPSAFTPPGSALTPAALASALWNHAPAMGSEVAAKSVARPSLTEPDWADVFAYLYSEQVFQFPAETRRGLEVFNSKKCAECHSGGGPGIAVSKWASGEDPATLVYQMWNHASTMRTTMGAREDWPRLDGRDFGDLAAYVQYVQKLVPESYLSLPEASGGKAAFEQNCRQCHQGALALETRLANRTFLDIGAGVWNHVPRMGAFPTLSEPDMRNILAYVWDLQSRGPEGNAQRGELVFTHKGCGNCHSDEQTRPAASSGKLFTPFSIARIAWGSNAGSSNAWGSNGHTHRDMWTQGAAWPTLSPEEISDLVAYLNYQPRQ